MMKIKHVVTSSLIVQILFITVIATNYTFAANQTPGAETQGWFRPFTWDGVIFDPQYGEDTLEQIVQDQQDYGIIVDYTNGTLDTTPTATLSDFLSYVSANTYGIMHLATHGTLHDAAHTVLTCNVATKDHPCMLLESYEHTAAGLAARDTAFNNYIIAGYTNAEIEKADWPDFYAISVKPAFFTNYLITPDAIMLGAFCRSSEFSSFVVGAVEARDYLGYENIADIDSTTIGDDYDYLFRRMNGESGITNRPLSSAFNNINNNGTPTASGCAGNPWVDMERFGAGNTTLSPTILTWGTTGSYCNPQPGDIINFSFDTTCQQSGTPDILSNKSVNITFSSVWWLNDVTLKGTIATVGASPKIIVDWTKTWSKENTAQLDGNTNPAGVNAKGPVDDDYECDLCTLVYLSSFTADGYPEGVLLEWTTESEVDNEGFNLWRSETEDGEYVQINDTMIPAEGDGTTPHTYTYLDEDVETGAGYYYKLEDIDTHGLSTFHGPIAAEWVCLTLLEPEDGAVLPLKPRPAFSWDNGICTPAEIEFSHNPEFTNSVSSGLEADQSSWRPTRRQWWKFIRRLAKKGSRTLYWRLQGHDHNGEPVVTDAYSFRLRPHSQADLSQEDNPASLMTAIGNFLVAWLPF